MDLGVKTLLLVSRMVKNHQEHTWGHFLDLKVKKCRIKYFWNFISNLSRVYLTMEAPTRHNIPTLMEIIPP